MKKDEENLLNCADSPRIDKSMDAHIIAVLKVGAIQMGMKIDKMGEGVFMAVHVENLRQHHATIRLKELKLAFEMASAFKLDFDPKTYQSFSPMYVNELLTAYVKWAKQTLTYLKPGSDPSLENDKPDWSYHIYRRLPGGVLRGEIQQGYENFLRGILTDRRYIPYEWWAQLVLDGYIEHDDDATVFENVRVNQLDNDQKRKLGNGQQMVWLLFELAKKMGTRDIYVRA